MPPKFKRPPPQEVAAAKTMSHEEEDTFYTRNKGGWAAIKVDNIASPTRNSRDSSDEEGGHAAPASKRRKGKSGKKEKESDWTKPGAVITLGTDSDVEILSDQEGRRRKSNSPRKGKGKAKVVRNRSITPPPQISDTEIMEAQNVVKAVLLPQGLEDHDYAMELAMEDDEAEPEDPEDTALLARARRAEQASSSRPLMYDAQSPTAYDDPSSPGVNSPQEEEERLKLRVMWKGPPFDDGKAKWTFAFNLQAPFRRLNEMMQSKTLLSEREIVLAHNSHRVLLGATPKSLRMRKDTTETIDVYPKWQWDAEEHESSNTPFTSPRVGDMAPAPAAATQAEEEEHEDEAQDNILVLNIRSAAHPNPISISAKCTAKSSSVLTKYLKKVGEDPAAFDVVGEAKPSGRKQIKLSFDGDDLAGSASVGSLDAENEDIWDVVGL